MDEASIRVLLVEDDDDDYFLTRELLDGVTGDLCRLERVATFDAGLAAMGENRHDLYLLDYRLGKRSGLDLLRDAKKRDCRGPIILLTGQGEREIDVEAMQAGAADFLVKRGMDAVVLERSIRYALERHRDAEALRLMHNELEQRVADRTAKLEEANGALREREDALKDANQRKDEFLAMLAHELRNPLAPIRNSLHILRLSGANDAKMQQLLGMMDRQVQQMVRLIDDLLDVSRITRGKINLQKEPVTLRAIVGRAVEASRIFVDARRHELQVTIPEEDLWVEADLTRMVQVLTNLLSNAAKFTQESGRLSLTVVKQNDSTVVRVRDSGSGIPADSLQKIFDLFVQGDQTLDRAQGGLGIGLTLVRSLVELHDGAVYASSEGPGMGSEFVVRLPLLAEPLAPQAGEGPLFPPAPPSRRL